MISRHEGIGRRRADLQGVTLYRDNHHLTARYAASLHDRFETVLAGASAQPGQVD